MYLRDTRAGSTYLCSQRLLCADSESVYVMQADDSPSLRVERKGDMGRKGVHCRRLRFLASGMRRVYGVEGNVTCQHDLLPRTTERTEAVAGRDDRWLRAV